MSRERTEAARPIADIPPPRIPGASAADVALGPPPGGPPPRGRPRTFDSLIEVPTFRWYIASMTGNWASMQMQQVARGFLVYQLTGSFAALGAMALANAAPRLFLALYGGVVADRMSRRYIIQAGQLFNAALTAVVAALLFAGVLRFEHLVVSAILQGVSNSFTQPARQAMIPEIVGIERLTNAVALNASGMNTMRLLAPALAGGMLAVTHAAWVYVLMTVLYVIAFFTMTRVPAVSGAERDAAAGRRGRRSAGRGGIRDIAEALSYLRGQPVLMMLLAVHLAIVVFSMPYQRLLPGFVDEVLSTNPDEAAWRFGLLLALTGVGALGGSLLVASMPNRHRGALLLGSSLVLGVSLLAFSASSEFWLSAGIVIALGVGQAGRQSLSNVLIQTHVSDEFRGRISSIMMMEMGLTSFGTFAIGLLAAAIGVQYALGGAAVALVLVAIAVYALVPTYRRLD
ncbi:MAG: MFS transporter [Dehalococcoidia bacterium]|nr:MFS transporter [Dehalococcoidia bacterium]